ncbi:MAG TPA: L,D-transpeptidase [Candidatus Sulfotelmatobacter sp.]|jgi:lipoprotein-anchoring transpeptidase ErfK/SrfK
MERAIFRANTQRVQRGIVVLALALALALAVPGFTQTALRTPKPVESEHRNRVVLVSIPDRKLAVIDNGNIIATFSVAVGAAASPSPTGDFHIVSRVANPTYYRPGTVIPSGKDNPVGTRWVGLSQKGYGIHGTNAPRSVGHAASHGCIRLRNREMEQLFSMLRTGDVVQIRGRRDEQVARIFGGVADDTTVAEAEDPAQDAGQVTPEQLRTGQ